MIIKLVKGEPFHYVDMWLRMILLCGRGKVREDHINHVDASQNSAAPVSQERPSILVLLNDYLSISLTEMPRMHDFKSKVSFSFWHYGIKQ